MTTSYVRKIPAVVGVLFFAVTSSVALLSGAGVVSSIFRGAVAGVVAVVFAVPLVYVLFAEKIPEPESPPELGHIAEKLKKSD